MTNQEAIKILYNLKPGDYSNPYEKGEAIVMAIEALQAQEAKHSNESSLNQKALDIISRQDAINTITAYPHGDVCVKNMVHEIKNLSLTSPKPLVKDTISRQAAIEAVEYITSSMSVCVNTDECHGMKRMQRQAVVELANLPSAQPEIIRCKECRHRIVNNNYGERGYLKIKGYCELDTGDPFELGRDAGNDDWFCADAERRTDE